jgi:hypothetical protein
VKSVECDECTLVDVLRVTVESSDRNLGAYASNDNSEYADLRKANKDGNFSQNYVRIRCWHLVNNIQGATAEQYALGNYFLITRCRCRHTIDGKLVSVELSSN